MAISDVTPEELAELFIAGKVHARDVRRCRTSAKTLPMHKCGRCWRLLPEVTEDGDLCRRCEGVVQELDAA